jgi:hypothetical protein
MEKYYSELIETITTVKLSEQDELKIKNALDIILYNTKKHIIGLSKYVRKLKGDIFHYPNWYDGKERKIVMHNEDLIVAEQLVDNHIWITSVDLKIYGMGKFSQIDKRPKHLNDLTLKVAKFFIAMYMKSIKDKSYSTEQKIEMLLERMAL